MRVTHILYKIISIEAYFYRFIKAWIFELVRGRHEPDSAPTSPRSQRALRRAILAAAAAPEATAVLKPPVLLFAFATGLLITDVTATQPLVAP